MLCRDVDCLFGEIVILEVRVGWLKRYVEVIGHVVREQALTARSEGETAGKGAELGLCILNSALGSPDSHAPTQTPGHT